MQQKMIDGNNKAQWKKLDFNYKQDRIKIKQARR